jgi:hypothetical protein
MAGERVQFDKAAAAQTGGEPVKRQQSTIAFPYLDLDAAIEVADAMYRTRGHSGMEGHELAATMGQVVSGAFRLKTGTARIFGLTEREGRDASKLSSLGLRILESETEKEARAEAFMAVPLYREIYDKYKGQRLPPPKALEREMEALGVSGKVTDKARQAFERSAKQAGYFEKGEDRLVRPYFDVGSGRKVEREESTEEREERVEPRRKNGGGGDGGDYHPFIKGLLQTLPEPGTLWTIEGRGAWLEAAATTFKLMYQGDGKITVSTEAAPKNTATDQ